MMIVPLLAVAGGLLVFILISRGKYDNLIGTVDKREYPLKAFLPAALYLLDVFKYSYASGYDRKLLLKIAEIHGLDDSLFYLKLHWACKVLYMLLGLILSMLFGACMGPGTDLAIFCAFLLGGLFYFPDRELDKKVKKRRATIRMDFPGFLNKLTLLINAGLTVSKAWEKVVLENRKDSLFYRELNEVLASVRSGKPEQRAYEDLARRCRVPEVTRYVAVILQNLRKGNSELVSLLRVYSRECWEMRKSEAKKMGEEASAKLLLPMTLMFLAILLIVATPAVLAFRGI